MANEFAANENIETKITQKKSQRKKNYTLEMWHVNMSVEQLSAFSNKQR